MADQDRPNQNANKAKAEGETTGGITNRPLSEEVENQEELPERGTHKDDVLNRSTEERYETPRRYETGQGNSGEDG